MAPGPIVPPTTGIGRPYRFSFELMTWSKPLSSSHFSVHTLILCQINLPTRELCTSPPSVLMPYNYRCVAPCKIKFIVLNHNIRHILIFIFPAVLRRPPSKCSLVGFSFSEKTQMSSSYTVAESLLASSPCHTFFKNQLMLRWSLLGHTPLEKFPDQSSVSPCLLIHPGMGNAGFFNKALC